MKNLLKTFILMLCAVVVYGQTTITGTVTDEGGETLIGASILEEGTTNGTITDWFYNQGS